MKRVVFILIMYLILACETKKINNTDKSVDIRQNANKLKDSSFLIKLQALDHKNYINKTVAQYLAINRVSDFSEFIFVDEPPGKISSIQLKYEENVTLQIYLIDALEYTGIITNTRENLKQFYNARISSICLMSGDVLVTKY